MKFRVRIVNPRTGELHLDVPLSVPDSGLCVKNMQNFIYDFIRVVVKHPFAQLHIFRTDAQEAIEQGLFV